MFGADVYLFKVTQDQYFAMKCSWAGYQFDTGRSFAVRLPGGDANRIRLRRDPMRRTEGRYPCSLS